MQENPDKEFVKWALSRFGPEWVEAHLLYKREPQQQIPIVKAVGTRHHQLAEYHPETRPSLN